MNFVDYSSSDDINSNCPGRTFYLSGKYNTNFSRIISPNNTVTPYACMAYYKPFNLEEGEYNIEVTVDDNNIVDESNEVNNKFNTTLIVGESSNIEQLSITNIEAKNITTNSATIEWDSNVLSSNTFYYWKSYESQPTQGGSTNMTETHSHNLNNLQSNTLYKYYIQVKDENNNTVKSVSKEFTTSSENINYENKIIKYDGNGKYFIIKNNTLFTIYDPGDGRDFWKIYWNGVMDSHNLSKTGAISISNLTLGTFVNGGYYTIAPNKGYILERYNSEYYIIVDEKKVFKVSMEYLKNNKFDLSNKTIEIPESYFVQYDITTNENLLPEENINTTSQNTKQNNNSSDEVQANQETNDQNLQSTSNIQTDNDIEDEYTKKASNLYSDEMDKILSELNENRDALKEQETKIKYLKKLASDTQALNEKIETALNNFITYGVDDNTKKLGAGERAAVIYSYKSAFNKLPETEVELADAIRVANGRWPSTTNDEAEKKAKEQFQKIYKRIADMNNAKDNASVTIMAYGLRQKAENRNLESEKQGIKTFKNIYGYNPISTEDWNIMQAITYSGATRGVDSDGDLLTDEREAELGTDPNNKDSDGDGYLDGIEVANGFDPLKK